MNYIIGKALLARFLNRLRPAGKDSLAAAQESIPVHHNNPSAAAAADFDIRSGADDGPFTRTARMFFPGYNDVSNPYLIRHRDRFLLL